MIISLIVVSIVTIRAENTGITWDEAFTYDCYANNMKVAIKSSFCDKEVLANNHILNSIMIASLVELTNIEYSEFIIRLPNILMLFLYLFTSYQKMKSTNIYTLRF